MYHNTPQASRGRLFLIATIALILGSCGSAEENASNAEGHGTPVRIVNPIRTPLTEYIDLNANTIFLRKEIVRATFQGFIEKKFKDIGDEIKNRDILFVLKTKESVANDKLNVDLGDGVFPGAIEVRAKSDGTLISLNYNTGDFINEGEEIATIANPSSLRISLNVPYQYAAKVTRDQKCEILLPDGNELEAEVDTVIPTVDPVAQTQTFLLRPGGQVRLPENLNVTARLPLRTAGEAVVLPRSAVMSNETQDMFWVMKLLDDSTAVRIDIEKGIETDSLIQVEAPLLDFKDVIISNGAYGLPDTARIWINRAEHE